MLVDTAQWAAMDHKHFLQSTHMCRGLAKATEKGSPLFLSRHFCDMVKEMLRMF